jgi:hypothetical protein
MGAGVSRKKGREYADEVQRHWQKTFAHIGCRFPYAGDKTALLLDGGNLVDNYKDKIVVTEKFMEDNGLS